ncbi:Mannose-6-phosphate isomerase [Trichoplax sp. H2]|nr:Mannose-6-phosphate isomerase [Trichoplax sp. H2]|eukprot:RDD47718.1 Mannose-6-phosphate isomerase [Trichoplax sp. H2]
MSSQIGALRLLCAVQKYAWGKIGSNSEVALLAKSNDPQFLLEEDSPYSELWMGTHIKGPSHVTYQNAEGETINKLLSDWIRDHPVFAMGKKVADEYQNQLPFLFKVLSVQKALSIQAHPTKKHAIELHKSRPDKYPDPNHKPEMAIALTPFEGLCGFRPIGEIVTFLQTIPEFYNIVGKDHAEVLLRSSRMVSAEDENSILACQNALKSCFTSVMQCDPEAVQRHLTTLLERLSNIDEHDEYYQASQGTLLSRLNKQFPGDVGCFCIYFFNYIRLEPGQCLFLAAGVPHAYLAGDCMECMACSDNVVRAGLTPKYKDVPTLCEMLNYRCATPSENLFSCHTDPVDEFVSVYDPPVGDFAVHVIRVPKTVSSYEMRALPGPSIFLVVHGNAEGSINEEHHVMNLRRGSVVFLAAEHSYSLRTAGDDQDLLIMRAFCV